MSGGGPVRPAPGIHAVVTPLPPRAPAAAHGVFAALEARRSRGPGPADRPAMPLAALASLLGWGCGLSRVVDAYGRSGHPLLTAPMPGGIDALRTWVVAQRVDGLAPAVHAHDPVAGTLTAIAGPAAGGRVVDSASQAPALRARAAVVVVGADLAGGRAKYGAQFDTNALLGCGGALQALHLSATALGLEACAYTGFVRDEVAGALQLGEDHLVAALFGVG